VLLAEPRGGRGDILRLLGRKLAGAAVTNTGGAEEAVLEPAETRDSTVALYLANRRARLWRTATPVVLHGFNAKRGTISVDRTERLLLRAFEMAGITSTHIESMAFQGGPFWPGTGHAREMRVPKHLDGYPRLHVQVRFREPVRGPVLAGIGRHYGIGLFAEAGL
jgi:CRISPR-associated protein Csb2